MNILPKPLNTPALEISIETLEIWKKHYQEILQSYKENIVLLENKIIEIEARIINERDKERTGIG